MANATPFGNPSFVAAVDWRPVDFHRPGSGTCTAYDTELGNGIAAAGIAEKTVFTVKEFDGNLGFGVFLPLMVIADPVNAPTGLTPDGNTERRALVAVLDRRARSGRPLPGALASVDLT